MRRVRDTSRRRGVALAHPRGGAGGEAARPPARVLARLQRRDNSPRSRRDLAEISPRLQPPVAVALSNPWYRSPSTPRCSWAPTRALALARSLAHPLAHSQHSRIRTARSLASRHRLHASRPLPACLHACPLLFPIPQAPSRLSSAHSPATPSPTATSQTKRSRRATPQRPPPPPPRPHPLRLHPRPRPRLRPRPRPRRLRPRRRQPRRCRSEPRRRR